MLFIDKTWRISHDESWAVAVEEGVAVKGGVAVEGGVLFFYYLIDIYGLQNKIVTNVQEV